MSKASAVKPAHKAENLDSATSNNVATVEADSVQHTDTPATPLNAEEKGLLKEHEATIKNGLKTFHDVGMAFAEIRDLGLYREHGTFDEYCDKVWGVSRSKAYRYMAAAKCVKNLECRRSATNEQMAIPTTETQARKMAKLEPEQQEVVAKNVAKKTSKPTAKDFGDEVDNISDEEKPRVKCYDIESEVVEQKPAVKSANSPKPTETDGVMTMAEFYKLIAQTYDAHNSGMDGKVGEGLKKLKVEAKKLADREAKEVA